MSNYLFASPSKFCFCNLNSYLAPLLSPENEHNLCLFARLSSNKTIDIFAWKACILRITTALGPWYVVHDKFLSAVSTHYAWNAWYNLIINLPQPSTINILHPGPSTKTHTPNRDELRKLLKEFHASSLCAWLLPATGLGLGMMSIFVVVKETRPSLLRSREKFPETAKSQKSKHIL